MLEKLEEFQITNTSQITGGLESEISIMEY